MICSSWFLKTLNKKLSENGYKSSKSRDTVVKNFLQLTPHVEISKLIESINLDNKNIGTATIYRTISLLQGFKLIEQKNFSNKKTIFEIIDPYNNHNHIICMKCEKIVEFKNKEIDTIQKKIANELNFKVDFNQFNLYGICIKCQD